MSSSISESTNLISFYLTYLLTAVVLCRINSALMHHYAHTDTTVTLRKGDRSKKMSGSKSEQSSGGGSTSWVSRLGNPKLAAADDDDQRRCTSCSNEFRITQGSAGLGWAGWQAWFSRKSSLQYIPWFHNKGTPTHQNWYAHGLPERTVKIKMKKASRVDGLKRRKDNLAVWWVFRQWGEECIIPT